MNTVRKYFSEVLYPNSQGWYTYKGLLSLQKEYCILPDDLVTIEVKNKINLWLTK